MFLSNKYLVLWEKIKTDPLPGDEFLYVNLKLKNINCLIGNFYQPPNTNINLNIFEFFLRITNNL